MDGIIGLIVLLFIAAAIYQVAFKAGKREGSRKGYGVGFARGRRGKSGGCFIASAAFGDPAHPCVNALRAYRDGVLRHRTLGRLAIRCYDAVGPHAARIVERWPWLRHAARRRLVGLAWSVRRRTKTLTAADRLRRGCPHE